MHIVRSHYLTTLHQAIENKKSLILLDGGRGSGKTTLLKDILADHTLSQKKYYFSFDEDIVSKKFKHCDDFIGYMQIKYGIDFQQPNILLLNEIQYSKNILHLMYEFLSYHFATQIIATGVLPKEDPYYHTLLTLGTVETITVYPFSFFDFLAQKNIYTDYLSLSKPSQVVFREIQGLFDEYLIRGGYPAVLAVPTMERKQQALRSIIQKVYDKDVGFRFNHDDILFFQDLLEWLSYHTMEGYTLKSLSRELEIGLPLLKNYMQFFGDNGLIEPIPYFFTNKTRELCHQSHVAVSDTGLVSYMTKNYSSKLHDLKIIKNFIITELLKHLPSGDRLMTYKKINNSSVDTIIFHSDGTLTPIVVSEKNTSTVPKIYAGFHQLYGDRIRKYIKTTPLLVEHQMIDSKPFVCVPHFMISKIVGDDA